MNETNNKFSTTIFINIIKKPLINIIYKHIQY